MLIRMIGMLCLICVYMVGETPAMEKGRSDDRELMVDGTQRSYIVFVPDTTHSKAMPLMIVLHGGLGNAEYMQRTSGMDEVAASEQFIVAYPNGVGGRFGFRNRRTWNAGLCCGRAARTNADDVKFLKVMLEDIDSKYSIDTRRVYVAGMSNGAMMAYRLAAAIPDKIAAVIAVSGALTIDDFDAAKDIPVMIIHGTDDENVPIAGGSGAMSLAGVSYRPLTDTVKLITRSRQCVAPKVSNPTPRIQVTSYRCNRGAPVVVTLLIGGAHAWPGGSGKRSESTLVYDFSASKQAWEFAKQFSKTGR